MEDKPGQWQLQLLSWLRTQDIAGELPTLLLSWERGEERCVETLCATPDSGEGDPPRKSLTSTSSGTEVQSRIVSTVIANLSMSTQQLYLIYHAEAAMSTTGGENPADCTSQPAHAGPSHQPHGRQAHVKHGFVLQQNFCLSPRRATWRASEIVFSRHFKQDNFIIVFIRSFFRVTRNDPIVLHSLFATQRGNKFIKGVSPVSPLSVLPSLPSFVDFIWIGSSWKPLKNGQRNQKCT